MRSGQYITIPQTCPICLCSWCCPSQKYSCSKHLPMSIILMLHSLIEILSSPESLLCSKYSE